MIYADKKLLEELSPLQAGVLEHVCRLCMANIAFWRTENHFTPYACCLVRIPFEKLNTDSEEQCLASAVELAPEYQLTLVRDVPAQPDTTPAILDKWPEKQFCHPEKFPGESSWNLNCSSTECHGKNIDEMLVNLLEQCDMLFYGWHLEMESECQDRYSEKSYRAKWQEEIEEEECLKELEEERQRTSYRN